MLRSAVSGRGEPAPSRRKHAREREEKAVRFEVKTFIGAVLGVVVLVMGPPAAADKLPEPVSPGTAARMARVAEACPTFNWTAMPRAEGYELVVYLIRDDENESLEVLRRRLPAGATGWTPSLDECLERGERYAWSIRAE